MFKLHKRMAVAGRQKNIGSWFSLWTLPHPSHPVPLYLKSPVPAGWCQIHKIYVCSSLVFKIYHYWNVQVSFLLYCLYLSFLALSGFVHIFDHQHGCISTLERATNKTNRQKGQKVATYSSPFFLYKNFGKINVFLLQKRFLLLSITLLPTSLKDMQ